MTSLRTFQTEIDEIHVRELAKQRAYGAVEREKENKNPLGKVNDSDPIKDGNNVPIGMVEIEEEIQVRANSSRCT